MTGYITTQRLARIVHLPISFPQTEVQAGQSISVAAFIVGVGQRLEIRSLTLNVIRILTPSVVPVLDFTAYQTCSAGLYLGASNCSPLAFASVEGNGVAAINAFRKTVIATPGTYSVIVQNNTINVDLSVAATGAVKLYL